MASNLTKMRTITNPSTNLITGPYNVSNFSHTVLTIVDDTAKKQVTAATSAYMVDQPLYLPKGVTDKVVVFEGPDKVNNFTKVFGAPNTSLYGPMATTAYNALISGFDLSVCNLRNENATFPNWYLAFHATNKVVTSGTPVQLTKTIYSYKDIATEVITFVGEKADFEDAIGIAPAKEAIKTHVLPIYNYSFLGLGMEGLKYISDLELYLTSSTEDGGILDVAIEDPSANVVSDETIHIPIIAKAYLGRGKYGNAFKSNMATTSMKINDKYPLYEEYCMDGNNKEHVFNWSPTQDMYNGGLVYYPVQVLEWGSIDTRMHNNLIQMFTGFAQNRGIINKIASTTNTLVSKTLRAAEALILAEYPTWDPTNIQKSNWDEVITLTEEISDLFTFTDPINECALSYVDMFNTTVGSGKLCLGKLDKAPSVIQMMGGTDEIEDAVNATGYSKTLKLSSQAIDEKPIFEKLLNDYYKGLVDSAIYDPTIIRSAIVFGEDYPLSVQETVSALTKSRENVYNVENTRPDWVYLRMPEHDLVTNEDQALQWVSTFVDPMNHNMKIFVGSWNFKDLTDNKIHRFNGCYDWLGEHGEFHKFLMSGSSDSIAAGDHSTIYNGITNSQKLVPTGDSTYRKQFSDKDINYFYRNRNGFFSLSEDYSGKPGYNSMLKHLICDINFNNIANTAHNILRDNRYMIPTKTRLDNLAKDVKDACKQYEKHFENGITYIAKISDEGPEAGQNVIVMDIEVKENGYSRRNRVEVRAVSNTAV